MIRQFPDRRFIGTRDDMTVYDCSDPSQLDALTERISNEDLLAKTKLSTFAPDTLAEARNRGFTPLR